MQAKPLRGNFRKGVNQTWEASTKISIAQIHLPHDKGRAGGASHYRAYINKQKYIIYSPACATFDGGFTPTKTRAHCLMYAALVFYGVSLYMSFLQLSPR